MLDAPITRLAKDSYAGRLNLLVGGELQVLESVRDVLDEFTENITHVGRLWDGHIMKLIHNFVSVGFMTLLAEAAAHANSQRVDMKVFVKRAAQDHAQSYLPELIELLSKSSDE